MAVKLPRDLVVANDFEIEKGILNHGSSGARLSWTRSRMPVDVDRIPGPRSPTDGNDAAGYRLPVQSFRGLAGQMLEEEAARSFAAPAGKKNSGRFNFAS